MRLQLMCVHAGSAARNFVISFAARNFAARTARSFSGDYEKIRVSLCARAPNLPCVARTLGRPARCLRGPDPPAVRQTDARRGEGVPKTRHVTRAGLDVGPREPRLALR